SSADLKNSSALSGTADELRRIQLVRRGAADDLGRQDRGEQPTVTGRPMPRGDRWANGCSAISAATPVALARLRGRVRPVASGAAEGEVDGVPQPVGCLGAGL